MTADGQTEELALALEEFVNLAGSAEVIEPGQAAQLQEQLAALASGHSDDTLFSEIADIARLGRANIERRMSGLEHEFATLNGLIGKNREVAEQLEAALAAEQRQGQGVGQSFAIARKLIARQGTALLARIGSQNLDKLIEQNRAEIVGSRTTAELTQAMQSLLGQAASLFESVEHQDRQIKALVDAVYARFNDVPGFTLSAPTRVELDDYRSALQALTAQSREFCRKPMHLITDKATLTKKFALELAAPLRELFVRLHIETERWLREVSILLQIQLRERKVGQELREENLEKILDYIVTLEARLEEAEVALGRVRRQEKAVERLLVLVEKPA